MAYPIYSTQALSTAAYTSTGDLITGRNQNLPKGRIQILLRTSAAGMNFSANIGGFALADDNISPWIGTTGALNAKDHIVVDQVVAGGRFEFKLRNTTAGALTTDALILFTPM